MGAPKPKRSRAKAKPIGLTQDEINAAQRVTDTICTSLSLIAVAVTKQDQAAMTPTEQAIIKPSLVAVLTELSERAKTQIDRYANPTLLIAGLGLWAFRLSELVKQPAAQPAQPATAAQPAVQPSPIADRPGRMPADGIAPELRGDKIGGLAE